MFNVNDFMKITASEKTTGSGYRYQELRPQIICKDETRLSVQASDGHYCSPRINGDGPYSEVEVGYPSVRPPENWRSYFDGEWEDQGVMGWASRVWKNRSNILYTLKRKPFSKRMFIHYAGFQDGACDSVYAYVPVQMVDAFINQHGGIDQNKTFVKLSDVA
jgi:hypothetical protein